MAEVKPAEVSAILKQELAGFRTEAELEEVGTVLQVGDGIARVYGLGDATCTPNAKTAAASTATRRLP